MAIDVQPFGFPETTNELGFVAPSVLLAWDRDNPREIGPGNLDAVTTALSRLYYVFSRDPLWRSLATYIGEIFQAPNEQQAQIRVARWLANAVGDTLDEIGFGFGLQRSGLTDDEYRQAIRVRGASFDSDGTIPEIMGIVAGLFGPEAAVGAYVPWYPAGFALLVPDLTADEAALLVALLEEPIPAGVGAVLVVTSDLATGWSYSDPATVDTWAGPRWDFSGGSDISATGPWGYSLAIGG
jgi:hypothetical protein